MTPKQISLLKMAKRQLCLDDDSYRHILMQLGKVEHTNELDKAGFEAVIALFQFSGLRVDVASAQFRRSAGPGFRAPGQPYPRAVAAIHRRGRRSRAEQVD